MQSGRCLLFVIFAACCMLSAPHAFAEVYVKSDSPGPTFDGNSWETAYHTIQAGVNDADVGNEEVWVAGGASYVERVTLRDGVTIKGGYSGVGSERDPAAFVTTIDGSGIGNVVTGANSSGVDGFTIRNGQYGVYAINKGGLTIANNIIASNTSHGVNLSGCSLAALTGNTFTGNGSYAANLYSADGITCTGNSGSGNTGNGLLMGGTVSANTHWSANSLPYVMDSATTFTVNFGRTLTIAPGVVVKVRSTSSVIWIYGSLVAQGTLGSGISFTSIKDDSIGGDTNNDGGATSAAAGDWSGIQVSGPLASATFDYCTIKYGGNTYGAIKCQSDGALSVTNSSFLNNKTYGVHFVSTCAPSTLTNNTFNGNLSYAGCLDSFSGDLTCSGNTASANGGNGLLVIGTLAANAHWRATEDPPNALPYVVSGTFTVNSGRILTIDPGAVVKFQTTSSRIQVNGAIMAQGTAISPIFFTSLKDDSHGGDTNGDGGGSSASFGDWAYVLVSGANSSGTFNYCDVRYGGNTTYSPSANLACDNEGSLSVTNSTVAYSKGYGVQFKSVCGPGLLQGNTFTGNTWYAGCLDSFSGDLTCTGNYGSGNHGNGLKVIGTLGANTRWRPTGLLPYVVSDLFTISSGRTLTIDAGAVVKFHSTSSRILVNGTLAAQGASSSRIYFTSVKDDSIIGDTNGDGTATYPAPGDWANIFVSGSYSRGTFDQCVVKYGGNSGTSPNANIACGSEGSLTVTNSFIESSKVYGVYFDSICGPGVVQGNAFTGNVSYAGCLDSFSGDLTCAGNTASGNNGNGLMVIGTLSADAHWRTTENLPYVVSDLFTINPGRTLTIDPGAVVKFRTTASRIMVNGELKAQGTTGSPIYFTSVKDDSVGGDTDGIASTAAAGDWANILVSGSYSSGTFDHCVVKYGGNIGTSPNANLACASEGSLSVTNSTIASSKVYGVYFDSICGPGVVQNNTFTGNVSYVGCLSSFSGDLTCTGNTGSANLGNALRVIGTLDADAEWRPTGDLPYAVSETLTINPGHSLTIDPGAVVKFLSTTSRILVNGELIAQGTADLPIYFTSIKDDSIGGDTNLNGSATAPATGDWAHILITGPYSIGTFERCVVKYGGSTGYPPNANLACETEGTLAVTNCDITYSKKDGVYCSTSAPSIKNVIVAYNTDKGVNLTGPSAAITYSDIWQNPGGNVFASNPTIIQADPLFVNLAAGDYRLMPGSPCIDTGAPSILDPDGSPSDMGALTPWTSVGLAKEQGDNATVVISQATVTGGTDIFGTFAYIEEWDRTWGIKVVPSTAMPTGESVELAGVISTVDGERVITTSSVWLLGQVSIPAALGLSNKGVGGGDWHYEATSGAGQMGVLNGVGLNNIGLLVRVWGKVVERDPAETPTWFKIDDGSGVNIKVLVPSGVGVPASDANVGVTGISSTEMPGADLLPLIRARFEADIDTF